MTFREKFAAIVASTQAVILSEPDKYPGITAVNFQFGHSIVVTNALTGMSKMQSTQALKYPLIIILEDFTEKPAGLGYQSIISPRIIIANLTQETYTREQRDELNFKPVLDPICDEFLNQLQYNPYFFYTTRKKPQRTNRAFWGTAGITGNTANSFNDKLDCIELNPDLTVRIQRANCSNIHILNH